jgi:acyl transferase domain-containing protein/acyl carrier protein
MAMTLAHKQDEGGELQTAESIRAWLVAKLAGLLDVAPESIDFREPFTSYGLGSLQAVTISGELGDWLGRKLSPTLVYDYPNVEVLARYLAEELDPANARSRATIGRLEIEPIAIIGMSCSFPGAKDPEEFWQRLRDGVDAITEVPKERWDLRAFYDPNPDISGKMNTRWGGFLDRVDQFDPHFFGISPREAESIDPQQRLLLEASWEALESAGQAPEKLAGSPCGVFVGISTSDYAHLCVDDLARINAYTGTGNAHSIAANRVSYVLDLRGPSVAIDTACSSSLVAVHLACQSLSSGECDLALAGGVNLILSPELNIAFSQARMMSPGGRCKTFDAKADGYVRGEGCAIVVLKRLSDALRDADSILALLRGSAVNQDGRSNGLTAPNGPAQEALIRQALQNAKVTPAEIGYVETHGTGTALGDPIEFQSLLAVLRRGRAQGQWCAIGSVKTNIGHAEAAAGIAGLIKVVLALQHEEIPPHLNLKTLNPHICLEGSPFLIPTERRPWPRGPARRLAGVSSFGFGGTNAHVIVEEAPPVKSVRCDFEPPLHLLALSAHSQDALKALAQRYEKFLAAHPEISIADVCFTAKAGRSHFAHRLAVTVDSSAQLRERLASFAAGSESPGLHVGQARHGQRPKIAFLFTGQGSQYSGMGRMLFQTQPTFRKWLSHCDELLLPYLEKPLLEVLYPPAGIATPLNETAYAQPALFAVEYALTQLWRSWGVEPAVMLGHSVGEYVAACIAGVFSLEEGLKLITERGRLMDALPKTGEMAAVFAAGEAVTGALSPYRDRAAIAASNAPANTVISGERDALREVLRRLELEGITSRRLTVSHAFHSPLMDPMLDEFEQTVSQVKSEPLRMRMISNLTGRMLEPGELLDAGYWRRQAREPVKFLAGMQTLAQGGYDTFIEVGPTPTLLALGKDCLPLHSGTWLPSLRKDSEDWRVLLDSVAALYVKGADLDWEGFHRDQACRRTPLPTYPFERERCWISAGERNRVSDRQRAPRVTGNLERNPLLGLHTELAYPAGSHIWEIELDRRRFSYLGDHRVHDIAVTPVALYIELAHAAAAEVFGGGPHLLIDLEFKKALFLPDEGAQMMQMVFSPGTNGETNFGCYSHSGGGPRQWVLHATGKIRPPPDTP